jgi:hypothetical protein
MAITRTPKQIVESILANLEMAHGSVKDKAPTSAYYAGQKVALEQAIKLIQVEAKDLLRKFTLVGAPKDMAVFKTKEAAVEAAREASEEDPCQEDDRYEVQTGSACKLFFVTCGNHFLAVIN